MPTTTTAPPGVEPDVPAGIRRQLTPWAAMGCLVLAATAARIAVHATGDQHDTAVGVAITAFTVAVVVSFATRHRRMHRKLRHRYTAAMFLSAVWLTAVTASGMTWGATAALTIVGSGLSLLYWREHRIDDAAPAADEPPVVEADEDLFIARWAANLGGTGRPLAGSRLAEPQVIKAGFRYVLHGVPGTHTVEGIRGNPAGLVSGLRLLPGQDVIVETHPTRAAPTGLVTIVTRPQVVKPQLWPGPETSFDATSGSVNLGPFVDGEGAAQFGVYRQDGMFGGYAQGGNGSGKSRLIDSIAMSCAASQSHPTVIWYGDGQHGSSSPLLAEHADWPALTPESVLHMLDAAVNVMSINAVENRLSRAVGFHPTRERPGLLVIIDECHAIFDPARNPLLAAASQQLALRIAREGRKVGVALLMASQSPTLDAFGGAGNGADTLRACLLQGNGVILRSKTNNAKQVFNVDIDPRRFPKLPGYAYLCDPEEGARSAPFRSFWVTDAMARTWPERITWRSLATRQANAAGPAYAGRHEAAVEQTTHDEMLLEAADAGMFAALDDARQPLAARAAAARTVPDFDDVHPPVRHVARFWMPETRTPLGLLPGQQKVLDAIRDGHASPKELMATTSYSQSQIYNLLADLAQMRMIVKTGYGRYEATIAA